MVNLIPIQLKLKRKSHKTIAYAQDIIVEEMYNFFPEVILHGGTAIWRCYNGNRFSEDIDVYLDKKENIDEFFEALKKRGFSITKKRVKENSLYSVLNFERETVRFEAVFKKIKKFILKEYETAEGLFLNVYTLSPEEIIKEKIAACLRRKKIRDLYDIFFLLRYVKDKKDLQLGKLAAAELVDEENLSALIISGPIPSSQEMQRYISQWEK